MIWLAVRQNRIHIIVILAVAVLLAISLVVAADYAARLRAELGVDTCVPLPNTNINCANLTAEWQKRVGSFNYLFYSLYVLPGLVASYVGGPLFAVEFERGTHRLAWTQGISRVRWAAVKLGVVLFVALVAGAVLAPFGGEHRVFFGTFGSAVSRFETFEIEGLALVSYFVFGLAAGAFVGAWSRRILTGMFIGLLVFGAVRVGVHNLRPMYQEPLTVPFPGYQAFPFEQWTGIPPDAWRLGIAAIDIEGRPVPQERLNALMQEFHRASGGVSTPTNNDTTFLREHGVIRRYAYQPADRFWTFQAIEAAIFTGLAGLFAVMTLWRIRTRDA
jgi:hypothetical protein